MVPKVGKKKVQKTAQNTWKEDKVFLFPTILSSLEDRDPVVGGAGKGAIHVLTLLMDHTGRLHSEGVLFQAGDFYVEV